MNVEATLQYFVGVALVNVALINLKVEEYLAVV